jgi:hypothetical protein
MNTLVIPVTVAESVESFNVSVSGDTSFDTELSTTITIVDGDHYEGATEVTPSDEEQVLLTAGLVVNDHITVHPIPSNYGRISWDGSKLTVS